jgi:hypothetical protein
MEGIKQRVNQVRLSICLVAVAPQWHSEQ